MVLVACLDGLHGDLLIDISFLFSTIEFFSFNTFFAAAKRLALRGILSKRSMDEFKTSLISSDDTVGLENFRSFITEGSLEYLGDFENVD